MSDENTTTNREQREDEIIKEKLGIVREPSGTFIIVVAISRDPKKNQRVKIPTNRGVPMGGFIHDTLNECYLVICRDTLNLGTIPVSFYLNMEGSPFWKVPAPVPDAVMRKYLSNKQKYDLKNFEDMFPDCEIRLLQLINPNS